MVAGRSLAAAFVFAPAVAFGVVGGGMVDAQEGEVGTAAVRAYANTAPIAIQDFSRATPYPSTITVTGLTGTVEDVVVTLENINHTNPDDIDVLLVAPRGQGVVLLSDAGGTSNISNTDVRIDDTPGGQATPDETILRTGTFNSTNHGEQNDSFANPAPSPTGMSLQNEFDGEDPNGTWQLYVMDDAVDGTGSIAGGWGLTITTSNTGPRAVDDQYTATAGETLRVRVPGVLRNDSDPDDDRLTARRVRATRQGTVRLEPNGSFTYRPRSDAGGKDTFIYEARDEQGNVDRAVVTITVKRNRD